MIARHITTHDETGMRLLGIGRDIYRTPTQTALDELALDLAARAQGTVYAQQRCLEGAAISKAYHCDGRIIVDSVYFSTPDELKRLYARAPLGDGLFFANAPRLTRAVALPSPASETLTAAAPMGDFTSAVAGLFPDEALLAEVLCALRNRRFPLALVSEAADGAPLDVYMALELMLRALPADTAAGLEFVTHCGAEAPLDGINGFTPEQGEAAQACAAYAWLPDGARELGAEPSTGDYARADALLAGTLDDVMDAALSDDSVPARLDRPADEPRAAAPAQEAPARPQPDDAAPPDAAGLERAQQALSASLRYANSHEFRRFTSGFLALRRSMDAPLYFRYCLKYSDYLHRLGHPMCEVYDAELAELYKAPSAGLVPAQIALTLTGYPGALRGAVRHLERAGALERFIGEALPRMNAGDKPEDYALALSAARSTLMDCLPEGYAQLVPGAMANALNGSLPGAVRRVTAAALCSVRDALETLMVEEPALGDGAFDPAVSELIDRIEFKRLDEYADDTYPALAFAYSYVRQWDGQVTDKQRAVCLWGRLMGGCSEWNGCVMDGMLRLLTPMSPVNRVDFMGFVRRYFAAMCDGGLTREQMSESVVMLTMLTALRFDAQNCWRIDELGDVLDRLGCAGEGLEHDFWQQINTRVDLLPVDMLEAANAIAAQRADISAGPTRRGAPEPTRPRAESRAGDEQPFRPAGRRERPRYDDEADRYGAQERTGRTRAREYDARLAARQSASYGAREGETERSSRRRSYSYDPDDPDGSDAGGRSYFDAIARYRQRSAPRKAISGETLMLVGLLMLFAGALAFCFVNFVL